MVESVLPQRELVELRSEVARLVQGLAHAPEQWGKHVDWETNHVPLAQQGHVVPAHAIHRIEPIVDLSPLFARLASDARVAAAPEAVLGGAVALFEDKLNLKLPGGAGFPWHQDWSCCWRAHTDELVTCFLSLDGTIERNGPLQVIPGSHQPRRCLPFRKDEALDADPGFKGNFEVDPGFVQPERAVTPNLKAGDMIIFDPYLLHYSDRNASDAPRRTIILTYSPARVGQAYEYAGLAERRRSLVAGAFPSLGPG